jgi:hypothetical protein
MAARAFLDADAQPQQSGSVHFDGTRRRANFITGLRVARAAHRSSVLSPSARHDDESATK